MNEGNGVKHVHKKVMNIIAQLIIKNPHKVVQFVAGCDV